jgi:hypothetical protein
MNQKLYTQRGDEDEKQTKILTQKMTKKKTKEKIKKERKRKPHVTVAPSSSLLS